MADQDTTNENGEDGEDVSEQSQSKSRSSSGSRSKRSGKSDAVKQSLDQALSPDEKHQNYLDDLERLHKESAVDALGNTPRAG